MKILDIIRRIHPDIAFLKCMAVLLSYFFGSYVTGHFHQESSAIGAILACTSSIVVLQDNDLKKLSSQWLAQSFGNFYRSIYSLDVFIVFILFPLQA